MWKWISRLLSPKNPPAAHPLTPAELAALVDLNLLDLNLAEARALLQQDRPLPAAIRQRFETFALAANALASQVPSPGRRSSHWCTLRRSARQLNAEFENLRTELHRELKPAGPSEGTASPSPVSK
jgi:hypothetical protein